jgi:hypothetical protein
LVPAVTRGTAAGLRADLRQPRADPRGRHRRGAVLLAILGDTVFVYPIFSGKVRSLGYA